AATAADRAFVMFHPRPPSCATRRPDRLTGHDAVVERQHLVADDLAGFMAFPGDHENIAAPQFGNGGGDRLAAVADFDRMRRRGDDRPANLAGWLAARVVVGDID